MTPEAQRIAIAEACGWRHHDATHERPVGKGGMRLPNYFESRDSVDAWTHANEPGVYGEPPRYLSDLNAMHEAEKILDEQQQATYALFLHQNSKRNKQDYLGRDFDVLHATAAQRAEAFLRTLGKWKD